jgi:hypothetical protein
MSDLRHAMEEEIKVLVLPVLRASGFKGSFPHYRRAVEDGIDLLTFQFDRHGGGFVVEIARSPGDGITTPWGERVLPNKVTAWDLHPDMRYRIQPRSGGGTDSWFRFDRGNVKQAAKQLLENLPSAEMWWQNNSPVSPERALRERRDG